MVSCVTPFTVVTWRITLPLSVLESFLITHVDPRTLCPLLRLPFLPCLVAMVAHWPLMDAVSIMLAKEAEDVRDRSGLPGFSLLPLHQPGWHPQRARGANRAAGLVSWPLAMHCVILGAILPCRAGSQDPPHPLRVEVGLPSNTDHSSSHPLPPKGT